MCVVSREYMYISLGFGVYGGGEGGVIEIPKKPTDRLLINMSPGITHFSRSFISGQGFRPTGRAYFCRNGGMKGGWTFPLALLFTNSNQTN